ncbi:hypothetical protein [Prochlorococcus sp. MIT 1223]|uniref:hypothetical protein n=1 Tax=Prochlorococcus sp. MIT 1223 TaxID=3096217 RepID=UPI002A75E186|nr:hypothetical protein [Prochlorococcus sp. MIT 1223]
MSLKTSLILLIWGIALLTSFAFRFWGFIHPDSFLIRPWLIFLLLFGPSFVIAFGIFVFGFREADN